ncbi:MAG: Fe-S cluster assembly protein SufD [Crocinitomicaceae bacterium]|nr:Fe-S cluster assembly protein SufD [Crocinitomicaceae bacterium]
MTEVVNNSINLKSNLNATALKVSDKDKQLAMEVLNSTPLPTTRVEAWKYTRVAKLGKIDFTNNKANLSDVSKYLIDDTKCTFVFVNGHFSCELSSQEVPSGISMQVLSVDNTILDDSTINLKGEVFNAMNVGYLHDGVQIEIAANSIVDTPIQVIHILEGDNIISNFKMTVKAGKSSQASIIQGFFSASGENNFCNTTSEIDVAENAVLRIDKVQYESEKSYHINTEQVQQDKNSNFGINTLTLNGGFVRNNLHIDVNGQNCETHLNGAYLLKNKQHVDNHSIVDHKVPNCESHELYKGVIDDKSTAVFNGKVYVRPDAQKINAFQSNGNVLLSDSATINSKPELEIYADDVKCSHGSTTGQLDEEAVFYLRARGLSEKSARHLMVSAFIGDVLDKITNENVKTFTQQILKERFGWDF